MPQILTISDFSFGKDTRKGASVADANRMRDFRNCYTRKGKGFRKRNGTVKIATLTAGTKGLGAGSGELHTFSQAAGITHSNPVVKPTYKPITPKSPGLNDLESGGTYTGLKSALFIIEIDDATLNTFKWTKDSELPTTGVLITGADQTLSDGVTIKFVSGSGYTLKDRWIVRALVLTVNQIIGATVDSPVFNGIGLNDLRSSGTYSGSGTPVFTIEIDALGTPDTFKWKKDSGAYTTGVSITGAKQTLSDAVQVYFGDTTNHTLGDIWTVQISASVTIEKIHYFDIFNGFIYVAAEYSNGTVSHHYIDGTSPSLVADVNCPHSKGVAKLHQKIWAIDGDTVPFSKTGDARDFTTSSDAGFLPVGIHQKGNQESLALGGFGQKQLIVYFVDGAQLWDVDPDPALHVFKQGLPATQSRYHRSIAPLSQDLYALSDLGPRSISENLLTTNKQELDIGSPLDDDFDALLPIVPTDSPIGFFYQAGGQYWLAIGKEVYVYTESKKSKINSWSIYNYPWEISDAAELDGVLYFRSGDDLYVDAPGVYTDAGAEVGAAVFDGNGLDDLTSGGSFTDAPDAVYTIEIDLIAATDTFKWKKNNGAYTTGVPITGSAQTLSDGVTITFAAITGHDLADIWTVDTGHIAFESLTIMPFLNGKKPSLEKYWESMDFAGKGTAEISFLYDPKNEDLETERISSKDVTSPGLALPIEITSPSIAPVIRNSADEEFEVDSIVLHFNDLGVI